MNFLLTSFASRNFYENQKRLKESANLNGIEKVINFKYVHLFRFSVFWKNLKIFRSRRGAGYWAWHTIVIREALRKVDENDFIIFCDAGLKFTNKVEFLHDLMIENHVLFFSNGNFKNQQYTKRDTFILMDCDESKYWNGPQVMGGFHVWKKCKKTYEFLEEYEKYCLNYQIVSDSPSTEASNFSDFIDHRHPQSIMSLLIVKYGYQVLSCPVSYQGNLLNENDVLPYLFLSTNKESKYSLYNTVLQKIGLWY
jgi:hypothetical protein